MTERMPTEELAQWLDDLVLIDELRSPDLPKQAAARLRELERRLRAWEHWKRCRCDRPNPGTADTLGTIWCRDCRQPIVRLTNERNG